jgi:hypothetical protein
MASVRETARIIAIGLRLLSARAVRPDSLATAMSEESIGSVIKQAASTAASVIGSISPARGQRDPIRSSSRFQIRLYSQFQLGPTYRIHVDHIPQTSDVGGNEIILFRACRIPCCAVTSSTDAGIARPVLPPNCPQDWHRGTKRASRDGPEKPGNRADFAVYDITSNGEGGIRTLDSLSAISVFETDAFDHSATSPVLS